MRNKLVIAAPVCHGNHLGNGNGHANTDYKGNIGSRHHQGRSSQVLITDRTHHGRINQVQRHLGQLPHNNGDRQ